MEKKTSPSCKVCTQEQSSKKSSLPRDNVVEVDFEKSLVDYKDFTHAAHGMLYTLQQGKFEGNSQRANILMVARFDGALGFPGGLIDSSDLDAADGLNREMQEEIALDLNKHKFTQDDHVFSHVIISKKLVTHFYAKMLNLDDYHQVEARVAMAADWSTETLGFLRVPLYTMSDKYRGLPIFLANQFCGNARKQLIGGIEKCKIMKKEELDLALHMAEKVLLKGLK